jgi:hypothetical protein
VENNAVLLPNGLILGIGGSAGLHRRAPRGPDADAITVEVEIYRDAALMERVSWSSVAATARTG